MIRFTVNRSFPLSLIVWQKPLYVLRDTIGHSRSHRFWWTLCTPLRNNDTRLPRSPFSALDVNWGAIPVSLSCHKYFCTFCAFLTYINSIRELRKRNEMGCVLYDVITLDSNRVLNEFKDGDEIACKNPAFCSVHFDHVYTIRLSDWLRTILTPFTTHPLAASTSISGAVGPSFATSGAIYTNFGPSVDGNGANVSWD